MQKQFKSVALAFLLIGYRCIRQASTELCLSKAIEFIKCAVPLLKNVVEGKFYARSDFATQFFSPQQIFILYMRRTFLFIFYFGIKGNINFISRKKDLLEDDPRCTPRISKKQTYN